MAPIRKDALQEVVNERMAKQGNKSAKQLYMDKANKKTAKVSYFGDFTKVEKVDLSYIPGREKRKEDPRAKKLAMKKEKEEAARMKKAQTDWTETDEFGNIIMSVEAQVLELASIRDASTDNRVGPIYPRGKRIECLDLGVPLENANSNTFEVLKPKKRSDYDPDESRRYPLAKLPDDKKPFTLVEKEASEVTINPQTGTIDVTDVHINACAVKDDDLFTVGRSLQRSNVPQTVDLYANYLMDGPISFLAERVADGIKEGRPNALHSIHLCQNNLGPATYPSLSHLLDVSTSLTSLNITNAFDPLTDDDGALLMKGLALNANLRHLDLSCNLLSKGFAWELRMALLTHTSLETIRLDCNQINDDALFFVAEALKKNEQNALKRFTAAHNLVDHVGFGELIEACGTGHSKLELIDLHHNKISRCSSGSVSDALLQSRSIKTLNLANNRIADMTEIGLGLYLNGSLEQLNVSENLIADDTFFWFSVWGKQKEHLSHTRLQNFDLRGNKLGDVAAAHMFMGLRRRKYNRTLTRMDVSDNLIDPLLTEAVMTFLDIKRSFKYNKMQAEKLVKQKRQNDKRYWKERKWEQLQAKRKDALDEAVRRLNSRTDDEVEIDHIVGATLASRIPIINKLASVGNQLRYGTKPIWQLQEELITVQKKKAATDIAFRKSLVKGIKG